MKERLKAIRKELKLTQQEFADRLNISRNNIATYETREGEPGYAVISLICREFNINETWLRTGKGEMFDKKVFSLDEYAKQNDLDEIEIDIVKIIMSIPKKERAAIIRKMKDVFIESDKIAAAVEDDTETAEEINPYKDETDWARKVLDEQERVDNANKGKRGALSSLNTSS